MYIYKVGVVGGGAMGGGIAQVVSYSGLPVVIKDVSQDAVDKGVASAREVYEGRVKKGKMTQGEMDQKMALISGTTTWEGFEDCDLVIEAVTERMDVKKAVFKELDEVCPGGAILASNTSSLSITELGAATKRPSQVIGMHFFNPAPVMKLVEVIPGLETSDDTVDAVMNFTGDLRKIPIKVEECAGFLVNRLLMVFFNEAIRAAQEGAASMEDIDDAVRAMGMPMGPFFLGDMVGLDVCYHVMKVLEAEYGSRMKGADLLDRIFAAGRFGMKAGAGFYVHGEGDENWTAEQIKDIQAKTGVSGTPFSFDRLLLPMINEAVMCLQEKVASPNDINIAMMAGTGMPKGPLAFADEMGLDVVLAKLEELEGQLGERFHPAPLLKRKVRAGHLGKKVGKGFMEYAAETV